MKVLLVLLLMAVAALRATDVPAAEQAHTSNIKWIYPHGDGSYVLTFTTDPSACQNPNSTKYLYVQVGQNGMTADSAKYIYAAALLAMALGKQFQVYYTDSSIYCYINRAVIID